MFVCLFVFLMFYFLIYITFSGEAFTNLTNARHSWPLSSEGSYACYTYCDMGHWFLGSSPSTCDTHNCCRAFGSRQLLPLFSSSEPVNFLHFNILLLKFQPNLAQNVLGWWGLKLFQMKLGQPFPRGDNNEIAKIHWQTLNNHWANINQT